MLSLGDEEARALGVEAGRTRFLVIACATLATASVTAIAGVVGWVGLVIPHIARMLVGPDFGRLLPVAARDAGVRLYEIQPADESLNSVFAYLVAR